MHRRIYLLAVLSCLLAVLVLPATAAARRHNVQAAPKSVELFHDMLLAADEWWTAQGSPPPCVGHARVEWGIIVAPYSEWAFYDSCVMVLSPHWWATQYAFLTRRTSLNARRRAAAYDLALLMHARGHNLGYRHIAGTVMQENTPVVPGWAFEWAARTIR